MGYAGHDFAGGIEAERERAFPAEMPPEDEAALHGALIDGTSLATDGGWRPVETLAAGDWVMGPDGRFHELRGVVRHRLWSAHGFPRRVWPLRIPPDLLENATAMFVLPWQKVQLARPQILAEAGRFDGLAGVEAHAPGREFAVTRLDFGKPVMVLANYGAALHCPALKDAKPAGLPASAARPLDVVPMRDM